MIVFFYLAATVGIDVHVNHHDGEVFVVSLLESTDCNSLHPEDVCHCVEHLHHHCHEDDEDCEDEISVVSLTGDGYGFAVDFAPAMVLLCFSESPSGVSSICKVIRRCDIIAGISPGSYLDSLCVLRV